MASTGIKGRPRSAVVWIDERRASVATTAGSDGVTTVDIDRGIEPETQYLARVVHELLDRDRVTIVGSAPVRLALEREFVSISHRPDRLVAAPLLVDQLRRHAAA
jgi:hypothetical protein